MEGRAGGRAQQYTEQILKRLTDYLSIRFDQAIRINPRLRTLKQDLMYHELENVRTCLMGEKIYGATRLVVANVLMSDDERKRRGLMSPTDQTSIQVELVSHVREEVKQATRGQIRIHDLKTFYSAIDPTLSDMMDLIETWIWWDIYDATELSRFEQKLCIIQAVRQGRCTPEMRRYYSNLMRQLSGTDAVADEAELTVSDEEILAYEFGQLVQIRDQWRSRRENDYGYMYVLQRDPLPACDMNESIAQMVELVRTYDTVERGGEPDEETKQNWAPQMRLAPAKVTRDGLLGFLRGRILELQRDAAGNQCDGERLGPPYRYKMRQLEMMEKRMSELKGQIQLPAGEPQPA